MERMNKRAGGWMIFKVLSSLVAIVVIFMIFTMAGCAATPNPSNPVGKEKASNLKSVAVEKKTVIAGEIDNLKEVEIFSPVDGETILTMVGFKSGDGIIIVGIHPGLKEGKKIKIYINTGTTIKSFKGTPVYEAIKIESFQ